MGKPFRRKTPISPPKCHCNGQRGLDTILTRRPSSSRSPPLPLSYQPSMWLEVFPPTSCSLKEICLPFSPHFPLPIPPTQVRSCLQPHPCFSLACLSRGCGSHSLLLALVWRKLAPEHGCLSQVSAELGRQIWVSLTYR